MIQRVNDSGTVQIHLADLQESIIGFSRTQDPEAIRRSAQVLSRLGQIMGMPVTLSGAPRPGGPGFIEGVVGRESIRSGPSVWDHAETRAGILGYQRNDLVLGGVLSEVVVVTTALDALAAGMRVHVVADACGGLSARTEQAAFRQIELAGGNITSVATIVGSLVRDFTSELGQAVRGEIGKLVLA